MIAKHLERKLTSLLILQVPGGSDQKLIELSTSDYLIYSDILILDIIGHLINA